MMNSLINWIKNNMMELVGAGTVILLSYLGNHMTAESVSNWYAGLVKPCFYPAHIVWMLVGLFLNYSFGVAFVKVWKMKSKVPALFFVFIMQAVINLIVMNYAKSTQNIENFLYSILAGVFGSCIILFMTRKNNKEIFGLLYPYTIWMTFAAYLHYEMAFVLNA